LHEATGEEKYHKAGQYLCEVVYQYPRNALGGFYHKRKYPHEMWADGIYMAQPFCVKFSRMFGENTGNYGMAVDQVVMVREKARHPETDLLVHAWDADRNATWADPVTGQSSYIWSRGMGWYCMALVDILEYMPEAHPGYQPLTAILQEVVAGLAKTQSDTGVWYQVVDQPAREGNWPELSGTLMYVYSIRKGIRLGLVDEQYDAVARKGWEGAQPFLRINAEGDPEISGVVQGMGVQPTFAGYVGKDRLVNSPHGLCAVMFAASEMEF
jgi:unsaturated rhamnogalacturonyl hydrolase